MLLCPGSTYLVLNQNFENNKDLYFISNNDIQEKFSFSQESSKLLNGKNENWSGKDESLKVEER